jgi:hypothetical protein
MVRRRCPILKCCNGTATYQFRIPSELFGNFRVISQVMYFIVAWLCAIRRGKGTGHPSHLTPGLVRLAVVVWCVLCVGMCACRYICVHVCVYMRIWCRHRMEIQPAFGLIITVHTCMSLCYHSLLKKNSLP